MQESEFGRMLIGKFRAGNIFKAGLVVARYKTSPAAFPTAGPKKKNTYTPPKMSTTLAPVTNFDVTTSWIPVITPWPFTEACSSEIYSQNNGRMVAFDPLYYSSIDPAALTCLPPAITSWWFQTRQALFTTSLGPFVCPAAYSTGSASLVNSYTAEVFCCPSYVNPDYLNCLNILADLLTSPLFSGYDFVSSCNWATLGQCVMTLTAGEILTFKSETTSSSWIDVTTTIQSAVLSLYGAHVNGFAISSSTPASSTATTSSTSLNSTSSTSEATTSASRSHLSSGADAGIGVGVALPLIIGLLVAIFLFNRRRRVREKQSKLSTDFPGHLQHLQQPEGPHELPGTHETGVTERWEL